jgi:hypothetical protein
MNISHYPDFKLIRFANSNNYLPDTIRWFDEELEHRYQNIREELEAYEEYQQNG